MAGHIRVLVCLPPGMFAIRVTHHQLCAEWRCVVVNTLQMCLQRMICPNARQESGLRRPAGKVRLVLVCALCSRVVRQLIVVFGCCYLACRGGSAGDQQ